MAGENGSDKIEFTEEQQVWVNKLVGDARTKARSQAEKALADETAKAQAKAADAKLAADQEYKKLSISQTSRIAELELFETQAKAYGELIAGMLKARVKALGEDAKKAIAALPESLSDLDKLNWLTTNESLFQGQGGQVGTPGRTKVKTDKPDARKGHRRLRI